MPIDVLANATIASRPIIAGKPRNPLPRLSCIHESYAASGSTGLSDVQAAAHQSHERHERRLVLIEGRLECPGWDSNPHTLCEPRILSPLRIPIPPPGPGRLQVGSHVALADGLRSAGHAIPLFKVRLKPANAQLFPC